LSGFKKSLVVVLISYGGIYKLFFSIINKYCGLFQDQETRSLRLYWK